MLMARIDYGFLAIFFFLATFGASAEQMSTNLDTETLLHHATIQYTKRQCLSYDSEIIVTWPGREFKPGDRTELRYVCRFIQDKDRVDLSKKLYETVEGKEELFKDYREIWDGSKFLFRSKLPSMDSHNAYFTRNKSTVNTLMQVDKKDSFLDGILGRIGIAHYTQDLLSSEQMTLHKQMEDINGHACYVIEAILRKGIIGKFWIDPAAGYNLRKVVAHYESVGDPPEPPPGVIVIKNTATFEYVIDDIVLEQIGDRWFPVAGISDFRETYTDGSSHHSKREVRRTNIVWDPNLSELSAFKMNLPEGTRVENSETPGITYVWYNGKIEKTREIHDKLVNHEAPPLVIERWYNGNFWRLDLQNRVVLLDFWGVWCNPCVHQIPFLKSLSEKFSKQGLTVIGVHTPLKKEDIAEFISKNNVKYLVATDYEGKTAEIYNVFGYPTIIVIDRKGLIRAVNPEEGQLESLIVSLLQEQAR